MKNTKRKSAKAKSAVFKKKAIENDEDGVSLDDAFGDDEDVEYAEDHLRQSQHPASTKPDKGMKKGVSEKELEEELDEIEAGNGMRDEAVRGPVTIKASKPISELKKGDRVQIDGKEYMIDAHTVLIDHGATKEMAIELYDLDEGDYQLRYFDDQVETTLELYELQEIMYVRKPMQTICW